MAISFDKFQAKIKRDFLDSNNKDKLFASLEPELRRFFKYTADYIEYFFETISEPMPLHAAASIKYFRKHNFFSEKLDEFEMNLCRKCEKNFIREISSNSPDLKYCANLHTALSILSSEHIEDTIVKAVEKISEQWKFVLFQQISICIQAVNDLETEEQSLLAPILKSFYINYSNEINCNFLLKELEEAERKGDCLNTNKAAETILSELIVNAIKNKYFSYFRIIYSLFPNWHRFQNEITSDEFMLLAFENADNEEHLIDLLYVCLEISKGNSSYKISGIENWYEKIISFKPEKSVEDVISFIRCSKCIDTGNPEEYIPVMPYYEENGLFSEILPAEAFPIGEIFVKKNTETILKDNPVLLREYLEKIGRNNIYHFYTELDCPEVPNSNIDCAEAINSLIMYCDPEIVVYCYFNTHIRKLYDIESFCRQLSDYYDYNYMGDYVFKGTMKKTDERNIYIFETSQFLYYNNIKDFFCINLLIPEDIATLEHLFEKYSNSEAEVYLKLRYPKGTPEKCLRALLCYPTYNNIFFEIIQDIIQIMNEIIETHQLTEMQKKKLLDFNKCRLICPLILKTFVQTLEALSDNLEHQKLLVDLFYLKDCENAEFDRNTLKKLLIMGRKLDIPFYKSSISSYVNGYVRWNEKENTFQFVPENSAFFTNIINIEENFVKNKNFYDGMAISAHIEHSLDYLQVCDFYSTEDEASTIDEIANLIEKICTDETLIPELEKAIEKYKKLQITPDKSFDITKGIQVKIIKTIENRLDNEKADTILPYLKIIKYFNSIDCMRVPWEESKPADTEKKKKLVENIVKHCDCETIAEIFKDTVLSRQVSLSVWLKLIVKYGKRSEMLEYFKNIPFRMNPHRLVYLSDFDDKDYHFSDYIKPPKKRKKKSYSKHD